MISVDQCSRFSRLRKSAQSAARLECQTLTLVAGNGCQVSFQELLRLAGGGVGVVDVGVEFDGEPVAVTGLVDFGERGGEVDRAVTGDEVLVHPRVGDVL